MPGMCIVPVKSHAQTDRSSAGTGIAHDGRVFSVPVPVIVPVDLAGTCGHYRTTTSPGTSKRRDVNSVSRCLGNGVPFVIAHIFRGKTVSSLIVSSRLRP